MLKRTLCLLLMLCLLPMCLGALCEAADTAAPEAAATELVETVMTATGTEAPMVTPLPTEVPEEEPAEEAEPYTGIWTASSIIVLCILAAAMLGMILLSSGRVRWDASMIAKAAVTIALAYVMSMVRLYRMPQGGSITLIGMLPIILFSLSFGPVEGMVVGFAFGILQLLLDPYVIHPIQLLVDYPLAYGAVALACAAKPIGNERLRLPVAAVLGYFGRLVMAVLSGVIFFSEYAGEQNAVIYSLVYNLSYLGPEALICAVVMLIPGLDRLIRAIAGRNLKGR